MLHFKLTAINASLASDSTTCTFEVTVGIKQVDNAQTEHDRAEIDAILAAAPAKVGKPESADIVNVYMAAAKPKLAAKYDVPVTAFTMSRALPPSV